MKREKIKSEIIDNKQCALNFYNDCIVMMNKMQRWIDDLPDETIKHICFIGTDAVHFKFDTPPEVLGKLKLINSRQYGTFGGWSTHKVDGQPFGVIVSSED